MMKSRLLACALAFGACLNCRAQTVETDPAPFMRPALFLLPQAPTGVLAQHGERSYSIRIAVDAKGHAAQLIDLSPDDEEFRAHLTDAMRFWLFYPWIDPAQCTPGASEARLNLLYRGKEEPRAWLEFDPMSDLLRGRSVRPVKMPPAKHYPREEQRAGLQGSVIVVGAVRPDGSVEDAQVVVGLPMSPGFAENALAHFKEISFDAGTAPKRCALMTYVFRLE